MPSENYRRSNQAKEMLRVFYSFDSERESAVIDALTDLQHLCGSAGVDFQEQLRIANGHYQAEKEES